MKNYNIKRLSKEDKDALYFIAKTHEELPSAWIDDYKASDETINNTVEDLILKSTMQCAKEIVDRLESNTPLLGFKKSQKEFETTR